MVEKRKTSETGCCKRERGREGWIWMGGRELIPGREAADREGWVTVQLFFWLWMVSSWLMMYFRAGVCPAVLISLNYNNYG